MKSIGLTGGIGSGKSTVSSHLRTLGVPVFDADVEARQAVAKGSPCLARAVDIFGPACLLPDGNLNRPWVAQQVFHDEDLRKAYAGMVQEEVRRRAMAFLDTTRRSKHTLGVLDVPLLIECGWNEFVDLVWLVAVSPEEQLRRTMLRDGASEEAVRARIAVQMSLENKKKYADLVIDNGRSIAQTRSQVEQAVERLRQAAERGRQERAQALVQVVPK
ncbi:MAG: dephospho-CoA kinase [Succiniclasticum sp.]|jgi:dephospho-CoA kinase|nr:dephospho-CoA kinase [Succiniclasticum sp.]MCI6222553.1 dephospho-CoA kinase [Selenomonadales bacterium]MDY6303719.1 dephospho-CoA kinase [Succiniclasticum sp.]